MSAKKFICLLERHISRKGTVMVKGGEYDVLTEGEAVVAEWVKTGAAEYKSSKPEKGKE